MSATSVYNALNAAISNNTIDLWAAANSSSDLSGLVPVMGLFGINSAYTLDNVVLTLSANGTSVQLTGSGSFTADTSYAVTATMRYQQEGNTFSLTLAVKTDWIFSDFFSLPPTSMQVPAIAMGVTWYDSILTGMVVNAAEFSAASGDASLSLNGFLPLPDERQPDKKHLLDKTPMIGPWPLRITGTVTMPDDNRAYPLLSINATGSATVIDAASEPGVDGPQPVALINPGLNFVIAPLTPPQPDITAFSTVYLYGDFAIGKIQGRIQTIILSTNDLWNFVVLFRKENASLVQGLEELLGIFGVPLPIPMNFPLLSDFYVAEVDLDLMNNGTDQFPIFSLNAFGLTIQSDKTWNPPVPFVTIDKVGTHWVWTWSQVLDDNGAYQKTHVVTGSVFGTMNFGSKGTTVLVIPPSPDDPNSSKELVALDNQTVSFDLKMSLPNFIITGSLAKDSYIPIGDAFAYFFGHSGPSTGLQTMNVTKLKFSADPLGQNYFATAGILFGDPTQPDVVQGWEINLFIATILVEGMEFDIVLNNGKISGSLSGTFYLKQGSPDNYNLPRFLISAEYPVQDPETPQGWTLAGKLYEGTAIDLTDLVARFIYGEGYTPPGWIPDISVDRLYATFTTGSSKNGVQIVKPSYTFGATISARWEPTIFDTQLKINASASIDMNKPATADKASGKISGMFSVNKIRLTAALTFGVPEATYQFKVEFDNIWLQATTSWRGEQNNRHQVVSLQLGGITLGDILEYLVNLAAPTLGFKLDSPWDLLKKVDLSRFVLTIDPKENVVEFVFNTKVDLVVAQLDSVGVRYSRQNGEGKVNLVLTGSCMGQRYTSDKPLTWDVVNDPPPAVPGQGQSLIDLRYLGLGQRVTFTGPTPNTVAESIAKLRKDMTPPPADGSPMPSTMQYSAESQWLIGLDVTLMNTVSLGFIFNDPKLYGLSVALGGERAGALAGLKFEILYKKITDEIGMFRIEFQVPDMFRTIQLGVVTITLGIIVIEIYTNGNFKIDLGFPYNQNFARSFSLQAYVFIGRGGFYFGLLNGDTSTQVPRISNGTFSPVIELGIGIAAGVGREITAGILSGGAYVELQVIFQGVLAWFNPTSNGSASVTYFKCKGIAALHGKIYGSVDFAVVKVSVTLEAYAQISVVYESYQPMVLTLAASVSAKASVKILFVRLHFSFSVKLQLQFVVGTAQPTPWILSSNSGSSKSLLAAQGHVPGTYRSNQSFRLRNNNYRRLKAMRATHDVSLKRMRAQGFLVGDIDSGYVLNWQPGIKVFSDSPRNAHLTLLPAFTVAGVPVNWDDTVPDNPNPVYRSAFVLFADTGMPATATDAASCARRSAAHSAMTATDEDTSLLAADILTQGLLLYAVNALPRDTAQGNTVTAGQIQLLLEQLDLPDTMTSGLSITDLATFFSTNINLWISGDTDPRPDEKSAMVLPMPPFLSWTSPQGGDVDFGTENKIGPWYEWAISQLLGAYFPVGSEAGGKPSTDDPAAYESFTSFMFRDFCLMVIQNGVQEMQKHLDNTTVIVQDIQGVVQNLEQVAASLPTATVVYIISSGDTIESVAEHLGATPEELAFLNPTLITTLSNSAVGTSINIKLGIAPEILGLDNADRPFNVNQCTLGTLVHQAATDETLTDIATLFQQTSVADMLGYHDPAFPELSSGINILNTGATFDLPQRTFTNAPADFVQLRTAGAFFVRYADLTTFNDTPLPEMANWYAQVISEKNKVLLATLFPSQPVPATIELPPGYSLTVPNAYQIAYSDAGNSNTYTTIPGDTLERIGFTLAFQQDFGDTTPAGIPQWPVFRNAVTSAGTQSWNIPAQQGLTIEAGSTIESLTRHLILDASWTNTDPSAPATGIWTYNWANVAVWIGPANILAPVASVTVPNAKTAVFDDGALTFNVLSTSYGLSVTDAATRLKGVPGLFAKDTVLTVNHLPAQDIDVLINAVLTGDSFTSIVNQSSRMLMSGLQLPDLKTEDGHVVANPAAPLPLYDLTGQQFTVAVNKDAPTDTALALTLSSGQPWIELFNSITVQTGQTLAELEQTYPNLLTYNPGLNEDTFRVGMVLLTTTTTTLSYNYTNQNILDASPATGLSVVPVPATPAAPSAMQIIGTVPRTYGLEHRIELQSPVALPIPQVAGQQNVTGNAGLWMLPPDLIDKALSRVTTQYEILATQQGSPAGSEAIQMNNSTFGAIIPFKMKRLDDTATQFNLMGVDTDKRDELLLLSSWLQSQPADDKTVAYLLLSPSPDATNTSGLTVLTNDPANAFLVKTNLSTISRPPALLKEAPTGPPADPGYYASLSSLADFLLLLWEGSVVGGTGYYFSPGVPLPGSAFDQQGNIVLQLLVIAGTQQTVAPEGRSLLPFNNCALIGPGADSTQLSIYIESNGSTDPSETVTQALVPPGNVGFEFLTNNPDNITPDDNEKLLKTMYSLMTYSVVSSPGSPFEAPPSGMPVIPNPSDADMSAPWQKARAFRKAKAAGRLLDDPEKPYWQYAQVMPVSRFIKAGTTLAAPDVNGLPPSKDDPYQGFGTQSALPTANFVFGFGDVLGNRTGANGTGQGTTPVNVGYTDNMIGVGDWPSTARYFTVQKIDNDAQLTAVITPRPAELMPSPSQSGDVNKDMIAQQQQLFSQSYYQLAQPGVNAWLVSSLHYLSDPVYGNKGVQVDQTPLWRYAAGSYAVTYSLTTLRATPPAGCATPGDIITQYGVRYAELAMANAGTLLAELFGSTLPVVPAYYPFVEHLSISSLAALPPAGWPTPTPTDLLTNNDTLLLKIGAVLIIPAKTINTGATYPTDSMQKLSADNYTQVSDLAVANSDQPVLEEGFEFAVEVDDDTDVVVTVDADNNTFNKVIALFANAGVNITVATLADQYKDIEGVFAQDKLLTIPTYVAQPDDTLKDNNTGVNVTDLVSNNLTTPDLFDPGALIYFGDFSNIAASETPDTLQQFADRYACPVELLLKANPTFALPVANKFVVPGTLSWPEDTTQLRIPYTIVSTDTLNGIAARFNFNASPGAAGQQLAMLNENMPGTLLPNIDLVIPVGGTNYTVNTGTNPSFATVLTSLQEQVSSATLADIVSAIGGTSGQLNPGGLFVCPPALLAQVTAPQSIPGLYNVSAGAFALANTAVLNLIAPNVTLQATDPEGNTVTINTAANDTLNSLITRFADAMALVSADDIVNANPAAMLFKQGAVALLPPAQVNLSVNIGQGGPYAVPVGPLQVSVRLLRPASLIYPGFDTAHGTGPVAMAESDFPPPVDSDEASGSLTHNQFTDAMMAALPKLRLGTGQVTGVVQDLWQVEFDDNGIKRVALNGATTVNGQAQPRFFALMPLYSNLVTRPVLVAPLNTNGTLGTPQNISYQSIDAELWARRFLEDMDRFLSGGYAMAVYNNTDTRDQLKTVMDAKRALMPQIAAGLNTVLDVTDPDKQPALLSAADTMTQMLGVSLASTYESAVVVQYDSIVDSAWQHDPALPPANLYGQADIKAADGTSVPGLTIMAAKTDLSKANSYVNFLLQLDNPAFHKDVSGSFVYNLSNFEFNISSDNVPQSYNASDWLTFTPLLNSITKPAALHDTDPGDVDVPIPLRIFPALPKIVSQQVVQGYPDGTQDASKLSLWNYEFVYTHQHAEQDYVMIKAEFNLGPGDAPKALASPPRDLFTELAQYVNVADPLWTLLQALTDSNSTQDPTSVANAVSTFASLAGNVAQYWSARLKTSDLYTHPRDLLVALSSYSFNARVAYRDDEDLDSLTLTQLDASPRPNNTWPEVHVQIPSTGLFIQLQMQPPQQNATTYMVPPDISLPPAGWPVFKLVWPDLNLAMVQNARTQMNVQRNQNLLDNVPTNPAFIFTTDTIIAPSVITPLNNFSKRVNINALGDTLTDALNACFNALFGSGMSGQQVTFELRYGFELVAPSDGDDDGLVTYLPIGLYPNQTLSADTAATLNNVVQTWKDTNNPVEKGGEWAFSMKLYSQVSGNAYTLMNIEQLVYKIQGN
ncbi:hypothetical protein SAMN04488128_1011805 [Chitinophaga eiseniae]|uniref:LysM domain-containing protein n=1 Tax=Chitinophaga eiseniae TaxID=634771 RepID=A0A1T4NYE0_9BACT|nr:hypothetical protein [Chitinophaga eiseniae]SJZ84087.1 hypothetical protein SAMN04488128_1011805 [Chitinophaga eiseniae]